eukprot:COSAG02_NODE_3460_length_6698_cov_7.368238_4_plen_75_part_00
MRLNRMNQTGKPVIVAKETSEQELEQELVRPSRSLPCLRLRLYSRTFSPTYDVIHSRQQCSGSKIQVSSRSSCI